MAIDSAETSSVSVDEINEEETEMHLINYLETLVKHRLVPIDFMSLRKLVKHAPSKLKIFKYVKEKYPGEEFLTFLKKYPEIFIVNPDKTVQATHPNYCPLPMGIPQRKPSYDEVDGNNKEEHLSDQEPYESDKNSDSEDSED